MSFDKAVHESFKNVKPYVHLMKKSKRTHLLRFEVRTFTLFHPVYIRTRLRLIMKVVLHLRVRARCGATGTPETYTLPCLFYKYAVGLVYFIRLYI